MKEEEMTGNMEEKYKKISSGLKKMERGKLAK